MKIWSKFGKTAWMKELDRFSLVYGVSKAMILQDFADSITKKMNEWGIYVADDGSFIDTSYNNKELLITEGMEGYKYKPPEQVISLNKVKIILLNDLFYKLKKEYPLPSTKSEFRDIIEILLLSHVEEVKVQLEKFNSGEFIDPKDGLVFDVNDTSKVLNGDQHGQV